MQPLKAQDKRFFSIRTITGTTALYLFFCAFTVSGFAVHGPNHAIGPRSTSTNALHHRHSRIQTSLSCAPVKNIVLVGGGHAHLQVIKAFNRRDRPSDWHVTLIDKTSFASYSGMVPGCVSDIYQKETAQIALEPLAKWAGIDFRTDAVIDVDPQCQQIHLKDGGVVDYDVLSLDIGSASKGVHIPGVLQYTIPTRPIDLLVDKIQDANDKLSKKDSVKAVVVGGGVAGIELAMCMLNRFGSQTDDVEVTLLESGTELLSNESDAVKETLHDILEEKKISVRYGSRVFEVDQNVIRLEDGTHIPFTHCVWAAGASPHDLSSKLCEAEISVSDDGWIQVGPTLQTLSHPNIFAAGDCATIDGLVDSDSGGRKSSPPKAGVYAVRSGPILIENISRYLRQKESTIDDDSSTSLIKYDPQDDFLKLVGCGDGTAFGFRFGLPMRGKWVWELKDAIDTMFMDLFRVENLPDLSEKGNGGTRFDTSQYDQKIKKVERLSSGEGAKLLLRSDDEVDFEEAWDVLRNMATDEQYREDVLNRSEAKLLSLV